MKKVILNAVVLGLNGETLVTNTGRTLTGQDGQQSAEQLPILFGKVALDTIIRSRTKDDEQTQLLCDLSVKLNETILLDTPEVLELSDEEFLAVKQSIDREALIVKARFLQMVEAQNPIV